MSYKKGKKGFTLLEMLTAMAILAAVVPAVYISFKTGLDSWRSARAQLERSQTARGALDMMARELSSASALLGEDLNPDKIDFVTTTSSTDDADICEVGYDVSGTDLRRRLQRTDITLPAGGTSYPVVSGISEFNIIYRDGSSWGSNGAWADTDPPPSAVKITITVQDEQAWEDPETFSTIVYLPLSED